MAGSKEIRNKIKSVQNTRKITKAMEMVAASKMKKAQDRMHASRPYMQRAMAIAMHTARANAEFKHPFLAPRESVKRIGAIVVTTDKGLCGGLNTNVLRLMLNKHKEWQAAGYEVDYVAIGGKGLGFVTRLGGNVVSSATQLGDRAQLDRLVGPLKVMIDEYIDGKVDEVWLFYTTFINTMKQEPRGGRVVPVPRLRSDGSSAANTVRVIVSTVVVRSGTPRDRTAALRAPMPIASSAVTASPQNVPARTLTTAATTVAAKSIPASNPNAAGRAASETTGATTGKPPAPAMPKPSSTTLPVMLAANTCPSRR